MLKLAFHFILNRGEKHFSASVRFAESDTHSAVHAAAFVCVIDRLLVLFGELAAAFFARPVMRLALVRYDGRIRQLVPAPGIGDKKREQYYRAEDGKNFNQK